jgi:hypothetical protein
MDTRYWGPSGWKLLHLIAAARRPVKQFWQVLPYILPCKFCRASLTTYYEALPIPSNPNEYPEWLWKIHNQVNDKLRNQGQKVAPDPPFTDVRERYDSLLKQDCTKTFFDGWDFLFCIADNHPTSSPSVPMPDAPTLTQQPMTIEEKNKYNLLPASVRVRKLQEFWKLVGNALPYPEWRRSWKKHAVNTSTATRNRKSSLVWLWHIRKGMERDLQIMDSTNFHGLCKSIAQHRSGCATSKRARTCRRRPTKRNRNPSHLHHTKKRHN